MVPRQCSSRLTTAKVAALPPWGATTAMPVAAVAIATAHGTPLAYGGEAVAAIAHKL